MENLDAPTLDVATDLLEQMNDLKLELKKKENKPRFEAMNLQLRGNFDSEVEVLMPQTFFIVSTTGAVDVLAQMKMLGWHGRLKVKDGLHHCLRETIELMLGRLRLYYS